MIPPLDFGHLCDAVSEGGGGGNGEEILCAKEELIELLLGSRVHLSPWHLDHLQLQLEMKMILVRWTRTASRSRELCQQ